MAMSVNSVINNYTYSYQGGLRAKLDKDDSGSWSKSELQSYADSYKSATGKSLDVGGLMEKYANEDGVIDYKAQERMAKDDALGFSTLQSIAKSSSTSSATSTSSSSTSSSTTALDKALVNKLVNDYTYTSKGVYQPRLDKNDDGMWSRDELKNYSDSLKKATGRTLDVDKLIEKYGNEDGVIDPKNQGQMVKDDALQLSGLQSDWIKANMSTSATSTTTESKSSSFSMSDLLNSMSSSGKAAFSVALQRSETRQGLLDGFNSIIGSSGSGFYDLLNSRNALQMYSATMRYGNGNSDLFGAMSGQLMNFTI